MITRWQLGWVLVATCAVTSVYAGCVEYYGCAMGLCHGVSAGGGTGSGGTGGDGGGGGSTPVECVPASAGGPVAEECGLFVSSSLGDDGNAGTKTAPFATITAALAAANGRPVYACAEAFEGAVELTAAAELYGGLDCSGDWAYVGGATKTALTAPSDAIVLTVRPGAAGSHVEDFAVTAADAETAGGSSIAVLVEGDGSEDEQLQLVRCTVTAGDGADGAAGETPPDRGQDGIKGPDGNDGCLSTSTVAAADPVSVTCTEAGGSSSGGAAGSGYASSNGGAGTSGSSDPEVSAPADNGGDGQTTSVPPMGGTAGEPGAPGAPGLGATGLGTLGATGYVGVTGPAGSSAGQPGQGGGGGGGARGSVACTTATFAGPSGGGGGTGGCGGMPGAGGGPGGSSIALASVDAVVTLLDCTLTAGPGGAGGVGSTGQEGGNGLGGGNGPSGDLFNAADGGSGGKGGRGGAGGGGLGGHSIGIAYTGTAPTLDGSSSAMAGAFGAGGLGGDGGAGNLGGEGDDGQQCSTLDFDTQACTP